MPRLTKLNKKTPQFVDSEAWMEYRKLLAKKRGGFDDGFVDKGFMNSLGDKVFYCKFCSKKMYAAEYDPIQGAITMSCTTSLCPGNINNSWKDEINHLTMDQRIMTNQYKYNSRMQW